MNKIINRIRSLISLMKMQKDSPDFENWKAELNDLLRELKAMITAHNNKLTPSFFLNPKNENSETGLFIYFIGALIFIYDFEEEGEEPPTSSEIEDLIIKAKLLDIEENEARQLDDWQKEHDENLYAWECQNGRSSQPL